MIDGKPDRFLLVDGPRPGNAPLIGQRPVVTVIGDSQADLFRRDFREGVFHHTPHHIEGRYGHGRTVGITPFVSHQHRPVGCCAQQTVIHALIEKPRLVSGGLGRQGHGYRISQQIHYLRSAGYKLGKFLPVFCPDVFKINIQALIPLFLHHPAKLQDQVSLDCPVLHHRRHQIVIKPAVSSQWCQDQHRPHSRRKRRLNQRTVIGHRRDQVALCGKTVGKYIKRRQPLERLTQHLPVDERIGVTTDIERNPPCRVLHSAPAPKKKGLAHGQAIWIFYLIIINNGFHRHTGLRCDPVHIVPRLHYIYLHLSYAPVVGMLLHSM